MACATMPAEASDAPIKAAFLKGRKRSDIITEGQQVEIGGDERDIAVCRKCWRNRRIAQAEKLALPFLNEEEEHHAPEE